MREGHEGTGPGAITPDGCAVDLYTRLTVGDEPDVIEAAVPAGAHILELGSGAGRVTRPLIERGFRVTAVDESAEMLEKVEALAGTEGPGGVVRTVRSAIESLDLDEKFDVVMLGSFLVHEGDLAVRDGMLETCRKHVADDGCVLIQREGMDYHTNLPRERVDPGGYTVRIVSADPVGDGVNRVRAEYVFPDAQWTQTFLARPMTKEQFEEALAEAGLKVDKYLTEDGIWVRAVAG
ncbi:class I SAM-dependent methyltransferase [Streptomyces sp. NPDC021622]|uniref:class I SAM-dependent methyltransferase n=1 Tax=Streptomyces sp. NPDC021622 TaxID=3155013 RepID=UPI0033DBEBE8